MGRSKRSIISLTLAGIDEPDLHIIINMSHQNTICELPEIKGKVWCLSVDTSNISPNDIISRPNQKPILDKTCLVKEKSIVVFENIDT